MISLILTSVTGTFGDAFFLAVALLPGVLFAKYFGGGISFKNRRQGILHAVYFAIDTILYIESRDDQVLVVTAVQSWPTRMKISQWEAVLDRRFIRVHRAYIVARRHITRFDTRAVYLGERAIEISRKYKDSVQEKLER